MRERLSLCVCVCVCLSLRHNFSLDPCISVCIVFFFSLISPPFPRNFCVSIGRAQRDSCVRLGGEGRKEDIYTHTEREREREREERRERIDGAEEMEQSIPYSSIISRAVALQHDIQ